MDLVSVNPIWVSVYQLSGPVEALPGSIVKPNVDINICEVWPEDEETTSSLNVIGNFVLPSHL